MSLIHSFESAIRKIFPSTFTIAIILTIITFLLALFLTDPVHQPGNLNDPMVQSQNHLLKITGYWYNGLWNTNLLAFAIQMMLILILGYVLASTKFFSDMMSRILSYCTTTSKAAFLVALFTILVSFFNWGLGLIFGAILSRRIGDFANDNNIKINYPLIVASGYTGLMVWHGGISGSAPLKVAESGHLTELMGKEILPVDFSRTVFSEMNLVIALSVIIIIPLVFYLLGARPYDWQGSILGKINKEKTAFTEKFIGAEKLDQSKLISTALGLVFLFIALYRAILTGDLSVVDPNYLNFILLGLGLLLSGNIAGFLHSAKNAMGSASGILIQFPLYFGIMGIMKESGLVAIFSGFLTGISNETTFPVLTFFSAGLVNIFVPSGGGQWAVQGPIIIDAANRLGIPLGKAIMALSYGDQVTNMLQPFWALPLLGITGLKAKDIIPYTLIIMLVGIIIFISGLLIF